MRYHVGGARPQSSLSWSCNACMYLAFGKVLQLAHMSLVRGGALAGSAGRECGLHSMT